MKTVRRKRGSRNPERDKEMKRLWKEGLSYRRIGAVYGISYERVRQCIHRPPIAR
uniref:sigma factor-like helix-turn-helix DNA-binding protein n=1 Tax=Nitrospira cf. moscoviensis SBR1015 TaxID=96242 RepID=UPI00117C3346|nr:sigma factor-like helix-turn-helix DNA-binding protein [Nitrospira cf. moscoviensis SBR1015]